MQSMMSTGEASGKPDWRILLRIFPYLREFRGRVVLALGCLILAKVATVATPIALKHIVDYLDQNNPADILVWIPVILVIAYGLLRFAGTLFNELRDALFARTAERAMRQVGLDVFRHLHNRELAFHLDRKTGSLSRDMERGTSGVSFLLRFSLFNILPTILEIVMVAGVLLVAFDVSYLIAVMVAIIVYVVFSIRITEWRTEHVRAANSRDNDSNARALDSLLNYETVKYFTNEGFEADRYDRDLERWESARLKNRLSLAVLNGGQALIIAIALVVMMAMAAVQVASGTITLGDFTMINAYLIQLFIPLNSLGFVYREIRQSMVNVERLFELLDEPSAIVDSPDARNLASKVPSIRFEQVRFAYNPERPVLRALSFEVPPGKKVAIVGASGAGKSTLARLLFRFYEPEAGDIIIGDQSIRDIRLTSLRASIGVVPQDTVLFNDTLEHNIAYGKPDASREAIMEAVKLAHLEEFVLSLPKGLQTQVGERGLKLSGGEKQRVAIARVILKDPPILLLDEATSSLDTLSEQAILGALNNVSRSRSTLAIAHRLSTIVDADTILVLRNGQIVESGNHQELLQLNGDYARLWQHQQGT